MGGSAFSAGPEPLETPRMPPALYQSVKAQCHAKLRKLFFCVASPIEGPGKQDFGDIDILVTWPKQCYTTKSAALDAVASCLGAHRAILETRQSSSNLAIPWPEGFPLGNTSSKFIQVDVRVCENLEKLQWMLFKHAHGDIWNVLGSTMRPYGLTIDDDALYLRVPEIEDSNRKRSKIFLSSEPAEIIHFLGLPVAEFWDAPFPSLWDMFRYAARCRLLWVRPSEPEDVVQASESRVVDDGKADRAALKSNDRRRMKQRPGFRAWVDEFVAECRKQGLYSVKPTTREAVTEDAMDRFHVRAEFEHRRTDFLKERQKDHIVKMIKASATEADPADMKAIAYRSCQIKALKRVIFEGDSRYGVLVPVTRFIDENGFFREEEIQSFLEDHGRTIGDTAYGHHLQGLEARKVSSSRHDAGL